jgi:5-formyltetrahydrofolate cyclo-ligase
MGGGYFDRTLAECAEAPRRACLIGLAHAFQEGEFERNPWDIDLDYVITPLEVIEVSAPA